MGRSATTHEIRTLDLAVSDSILGMEIVEALASFKEWTPEELVPALNVLAKDFPKYDEFWKRYHSMGVRFDPRESVDWIELDARAAKINEPTPGRIPADSPDAQIGAAIRKLFAELGPVPGARAAAKPAPKTKSTARGARK
jgi:hypothetical protein